MSVSRSRTPKCHEPRRGLQPHGQWRLIQNVGEFNVQFLTNEGYLVEIPIQLADIERPLIAVSVFAKAGNLLELNENGGRITHVEAPEFFACGFPFRRRRQLLFSGSPCKPIPLSTTLASR